MSPGLLLRSLLTLLAAGMLLSTASCAGNPAERTFPVRGQVLFRGKPAVGARVTFVPRDRSGTQAPRPTAAVERDGMFRLTTRLAYDGAPAGRYAVTIVYRSPAKKIDDENAGPDLLRGKYRDPKTTPLEVVVQPGDNDLPMFKLP